MSDKTRLPVPKFGSFKPKKSASTPGVSQDEAPSSRNEERDLKLGKHHVEEPQSKRDRSRRRSQSSHPTTDHYSPERRKARSKRHHNRRSDRFEETGDAELNTAYSDRYAREIYFIDTKGDPANLQYRRSNKWTVPKYRLYGNGSIVGLDPDIKIDKRFNGQSSYSLTYPSRKVPARVIEPVEFDGELKHAPAHDEAGDKSGDDDDEEADATEETEVRDAEMDFVSLPIEENDDEGEYHIATFL